MSSCWDHGCPATKGLKGFYSSGELLLGRCGRYTSARLLPSTPPLFFIIRQQIRTLFRLLHDCVKRYVRVTPNRALSPPAGGPTVAIPPPGRSARNSRSTGLTCTAAELCEWRVSGAVEPSLEYGIRQTSTEPDARLDEEF